MAGAPLCEPRSLEVQFSWQAQHFVSPDVRVWGWAWSPGMSGPKTKYSTSSLYRRLVNPQVQISWQAEHFVNLEVQMSWRAQHLVSLQVQISWQA